MSECVVRIKTPHRPGRHGRKKDRNMNKTKEYMDGFRDGHDHGYGAGYEAARKEIEDASPWRRVEDELPVSGVISKIVLACNDVGTVNAAYLSSNGKWYAANNTLFDVWTWMPHVTHWMPFPEPPKEVQE